jgi:TPR repeat protein
VGSSLWNDRLAEVWAAPMQAGSGVVLASELVLTARHIVSEALDGGAVLARIVRPGIRVAGWMPMEVIADDAAWDIALLRVDPDAGGSAARLATATAWDAPSSPEPVVVRLGSSAEPGCEVVGFPRSEVQRSAAGAPTSVVRQSEQAVGTVLPAGQGKTPANPDRPLPLRWMPFDVETSSSGSQAAWSGMSGAGVVLPDGRLIGVVVAAEAGHQARRLYVVPLADVLDRSARFSVSRVALGVSVQPEVREAPVHRRVLARGSLTADGSPRRVNAIEDLGAFGVKPADVPGEPPYLRYVDRDDDGPLADALARAEESNRMLLLVGSAASGKSRSLAEAIRNRYPEHRFFEPVEGALAELADLAAVRDGPALVWLDDLQRHTRDPMLRQSLAALLGDGAVVVATIRRAELDRLTPTGDVRDPAGEALSDSRLVSRVDWRLSWTAAERTRGAEAVQARAARDALVRGVPLGVWAIAGPQLLQRLRDAEKNDDWPARYALVRGVLTWYRTGVLEPMPARLAARVVGAVGDLDPPPDDEELAEALRWATEPVVGDGRRTRQSLLRESPEGALALHDYVLDQDDVWGAIPQAVWDAVLEHAGDNHETRLKIGLVAYAHMNQEVANRALRPAAEAGHVNATWLLGRVLEQHDPGEARTWFERAAAAGSVEAMVELGALLATEDPEAARRWYERAADAGSVDAMNNLGVMLWPTDPEAALPWIERAAEGGVVEAMNAMGIALSEEDPLRARSWFEKAVASGFVQAEYNLGVQAERVERDIAEALRHYERAAEAGHPDAAYNLGNLLWPSQPERAQHWLQRAAELGVVDANLKLADILYQSQPAEARRWLETAAEDGAVEAMAALAYNILVGAMPGDDAEARHWFERAARAGSTDAAALLGGLLSEDGDYAAARVWLEQAARQGSAEAHELLRDLEAREGGQRAALQLRAEAGEADAMFNLGTQLIDEDRRAARAWLTRAAELGHVGAMNNAAATFLPDAPQEARMWWERAAAAGSTDAMHNLARLAGDNDPDARRWLERAAEGGGPRAMYELGELLMDEDRDLGLTWLRRAARAGDTFAMNSLGIALAESDREEAEHWFRLGARAGYDKAMFNLAHLLLDTNPAEARQWQRAAAESGHTGAMLALAVQSIEEARAGLEQRLEAASRDGDMQALFDIQRLLGDELYGGREWLERAAQAGDENAAQILASASPAVRRPTGVDLGDPRASSQTRGPESPEP